MYTPPNAGIRVLVDGVDMGRNQVHGGFEAHVWDTTVNAGEYVDVVFDSNGSNDDDWFYIDFLAMNIDEFVATNCAEIYTYGYNIQADLNKDCYVNFEDFALFSLEWLKCNDPEDLNCVQSW
jgi:hypothetical protein